MSFEYPSLILANPEGKVFNHPHLKLAGRSGDRLVLPHPSELVPLPMGSQLFTLPGRIPIGWDEERGFSLSEKMKMGRTEVDTDSRRCFPPAGIYPYTPSSHPTEAKGPDTSTLGL